MFFFWHQMHFIEISCTDNSYKVTNTLASKNIHRRNILLRLATVLYTYSNSTWWSFGRIYKWKQISI